MQIHINYFKIKIKEKGRKIQISTIIITLHHNPSSPSIVTALIKSIVREESLFFLSQILSSFWALTRGLSLAIASLPTALKSNVHPCCSGYLWVPQNVTPHLHVNPINPTRFLHDEHRFGLTTAGTSADVASYSIPRLSTSKFSGKKIAEEDGNSTGGAGEGKSEFSTADLADFSCSAFMEMSR